MAGEGRGVGLPLVDGGAEAREPFPDALLKRRLLVRGVLGAGSQVYGRRVEPDERLNQLDEILFVRRDVLIDGRGDRARRQRCLPCSRCRA
jgi:hypothetical protein